MNVTQADQAKIYNEHYPVLLEEVIRYLNIKKGGKYLDCTFGAGGYARAILENEDCSLVALDQDPTVKIYADKIKDEFGEKFTFIQTNFADPRKKLVNMKFDGIVLDLGVSSMQLDIGRRGFSFMNDGPLDMRMGNEGLSAREFVETASEEEIANVIYEYGEEVQSRAIAKGIVEYRKENKIDTTFKLANIVRNSMHYRNAKIDPATKTFQALRIFVNDELHALKQVLENAKELLTSTGNIAVVSFHSLEDSIVKNFFRAHSEKKVARSKYAKPEEIVNDDKWLKIITKRPVTPSKAEISKNIRSRSAKLRVAQKVGGKNAL